jgi:hypothetical protein
MMRRDGLSLAGLLIIIGVVVVLFFAVVGITLYFVLIRARERSNQQICMSNLSSIGKACMLYRNVWHNRWPWIHNVRSGWADAATGTHRERDPYDDPNAAGQRSITSLMYLLVRQELAPAKLFVCPSDEAVPDPNPSYRSGADESFWDFPSDRNVSYSWQAPVFYKGQYRQGLSDDDPDVVMVADKTPACDDPDWTPDDVSALSDPAAVRRNMSRNHRGRVVNALMVGGNVVQERRPDFGTDRDNIYTASGHRRRGSRTGTSLDVEQHLATRDSFLIGPTPE